MKKIIWLIAVILAIVAAALIAGEILRPDKKAEAPITEEQDSFAINVNFTHETDNFYNVQVEYPQFKNADTAFNKKIADLINGEVDSFRKDAKANWEARRATATPENPVPENPEQPFDFIATWQPAQINNNYISFIVNLYYFVGGAHGVTEVHAFNYDIKKQKEIAILDFLNSSQVSLDSLAKLAAQNLTSQFQTNGILLDDFLKQMIQDGTKPTAENYQNFNFNYNSLTVYFQQYQVAPGALGPQTITFYKDTLEQNFINSDYLK